MLQKNKHKLFDKNFNNVSKRATESDIAIILTTKMILL